MRAFLAAVGVALAAGCSNMQSASHFEAPDGWSGTPPILGRVQVWHRRSESIMLLKGTAGHADVFYNPAPALRSMHEVRVVNTTVCGNRAVQYYYGVKTDGSVVEGISVPAPGNARWIALYLRPKVSTPPDPQAERAIRSLCPA